MTAEQVISLVRELGILLAAAAALYAAIKSNKAVTVATETQTVLTTVKEAQTAAKDDLTALKETVAPIPLLMDGMKAQFDEVNKALGAAEGREAGIAEEKAKRALEDAATRAALASLAAAPLSAGKVDAPVSVSIVPDETAPVPVIVQTVGG